MNTFQEIPANNLSLSLRKLVYGVGINNANYKVNLIIEGKKVSCPYYEIWKSMLQRCYVDHPTKFSTYRDCFVCEEWKYFSNFKSWMEEQDWKDKALDKDLLVRGNKEYSPRNCIFITQALNNLLTTRASKRGKYLIGVCWDTNAKKFLAKCSVNGKNKNLGRFISELEAHKTYMRFKKQLIISIANSQTDLRLKQALLCIANTEY